MADRRSAWERLAEALGIKTEINWDAVGKRRQMQQHGSMDRRDRQGPMPYFKPRGMQQQRQNRQARGSGPIAARPGQPPPQIPFGTDRPGQANPLFTPPQNQPPQRPRSPLSTSPNSPQAMRGDDDGEQY